MTSYQVPRGVWRLWKPCDWGMTLPDAKHSNPCGFLEPLIDKGWDRAMAEGFYPGEVSLDESIERYPDVFVMWRTGEWPRKPGTNPPELIDGVPRCGRMVNGQPLICEPRGPEYEALAESIVPGFWKAAAPRIARSHALGGRWMIYMGLPSVASFPMSATKTRRNALMDSWIDPALRAGIDGRDYFAGDAAGACSQKDGRNQAMLWAERVLHRGPGFATEAHGEIHSELYPWHNGRFAAISARAVKAEDSRWDLVCRDKGWFGPGANHAIKEHFCAIQGSVPVEARPDLIVQGEVNGSKCSTILEMSDLPRAWLGLPDVRPTPAN